MNLKELIEEIEERLQGSGSPNRLDRLIQLAQVEATRELTAAVGALETTIVNSRSDW